jgi:hypothetical protein
MDHIHYQYVILVELKDLDEVRFNVLDYLITHKKKKSWKGIQQVSLGDLMFSSNFTIRFDTTWTWLNKVNKPNP